LALLLAGMASGCGAAAPAPAAAAPRGTAPVDVGASFDIPAPVALAPKHEVTDRVEIRTSMGSMVIGLYGKEAPVTVANFLSYVDRGFYSSKIFHRVIPGFMIQGGGFDEAMTRQETDPPIRLELVPGLKDVPGVVSMARTNDPNSATAQFFICVAEAAQLNGTYSAFGMLEEGFEVAANISAVKTRTLDTDRGKMEDVPVATVVIEEVKRLPIP